MQLNNLTLALEKHSKKKVRSWNIFKGFPLISIAYAAEAKKLFNFLNNKTKSDYAKTLTLVQLLNSSLLVKNPAIRDMVVASIASFVPENQDQVNNIKQALDTQCKQKRRVWWKLWLGKVFVLPENIRYCLNQFKAVIAKNFELVSTASSSRATPPVKTEVAQSAASTLKVVVSPGAPPPPPPPKPNGKGVPPPPPPKPNGKGAAATTAAS